MNFTQLKYFQELANTGHFTKAAQKLHLTQSALSSTVKRMEEELGFELFQRDGRRMILSEEGVIFFNKVNIILNEYEEGVTAARKLHQMDDRVVNIGTTSVQFHQPFMLAFLQQHPDAIINQHTFMANDLAGLRMKNLDVDCIVSYVPIEGEGIISRKIYTDKLMLIVSRDHPLATKPAVTIEDIKNLPFVSLPHGYPYRDLTDRLFKKKGYEQNVIIESYPEQFPGIVSKGLASVIGTSQSVRNGFFSSDCVVIPFDDPDFSRDFFVIWREDVQLSRYAKLFLESILKEFPYVE